jgi:tRNA dimethylallyltransferase
MGRDLDTPNAGLPLAVFIMGPTAAGKTDLAITLQDWLPGRIISVDSAMIYRGMDIGTAKPRPEELARAPHRLIDLIDPVERYSVADFRREMDAAVAEGRVPLLTGGTMMYFKALKEGFADVPVADPSVRERLQAYAEAHGWDSLHQRLRQVDPDAAAKIHPNNRQRLLRAVEVYESTGRSLSSYWSASGRWSGPATAGPQAAQLPYNLVELALAPESRQTLHGRIDARFRMMLNEGLIEEVERLRSRGDLDLSLPSMRCVGYRQVWEFLDGNSSRDELVNRGIAATRQLAKRQLTWLRGWRQAHNLDSNNPNLYRNVLKLIEPHTTLNGRV